MPRNPSSAGVKRLCCPRRGPARGAGDVPTWGRAAAAAAGSRRPWLRRPRAAAPGNSSGSAPRGSAAPATAAPAHSLGRRVTWPGRRASLPGPRNPLPELPAPRLGLRSATADAPEPGLACGAHPNRKPRSSASDHRHPGCMPASARAGKLFGAYLGVVLQGEGSFLRFGT